MKNVLLSQLMISDNKQYEELISNSINNNPLRRNQRLGKAEHSLVVKFKYTNLDDEFSVSEGADVGESSDPEDGSEGEGLYRGALSAKEAANNRTIPSREDRLLFKKLLISAYSPAKQLKISSIRFKNYDIATWYSSPYPEEYTRSPVLYICENCLKYMSSNFTLQRHKLKCDQVHPPGNEIYRDEASRVAIFEVDGRKNIIYCQNLCLLAKLFLNSKTLYYDVEPFMFYVLTELDDANNYNFVGYFSKEKLNSTNYNLSCILTLPIYQRKGYGNLLMDFSYLLTRREGKIGTPEKPLSDLGLVSYRNYWKIAVAKKLDELNHQFSGRNFKISIAELSQLTGMTPSDVVVGLEQLNALYRDAHSKQYLIKLDMRTVAAELSRWQAKKYVTVASERLLWVPLIIGPSGGINQVGSVLEIVQVDGQVVKDDVKDDVKSLGRVMVGGSASVEEQVLRRVVRYNELDDEPDDEPNLASYDVCYPGMPMDAVRRRIVVGELESEEEEQQDDSEGEQQDEEPQDDEPQDDSEDYSEDEPEAGVRSSRRIQQMRFRNLNSRKRSLRNSTIRRST